MSNPNSSIKFGNLKVERSFEEFIAHKMKNRVFLTVVAGIGTFVLFLILKPSFVYSNTNKKYKTKQLSVYKLIFFSILFSIIFYFWSYLWNIMKVYIN
jgi:predicted membrane protein